MKLIVNHDEYGNAILISDNGTCYSGGIADQFILEKFGTYNVPDGTEVVYEIFR